MKTITALRNAKDALDILDSNDCAEFRTYNNCIDWDSLVKTLDSLNFTIKEYEQKQVMLNAKLIQNAKIK